MDKTSFEAELDATFDQIFNTYMEDTTFSAEEVTGTFRKQGVAVSEEQIGYEPPSGDEDDWSTV